MLHALTAAIDPDSPLSTVVDWGVVASALVAIVGLFALMPRTRLFRWAFGLIHADRDRRFADQAVAAITPVLDERDAKLEARIREVATDTKAEVRGIIATHTDQEMIGVRLQTEALVDVGTTAKAALALGVENREALERLLEHAGLTQGSPTDADAEDRIPG